MRFIYAIFGREVRANEFRDRIDAMLGYPLADGITLHHTYVIKHEFADVWAVPVDGAALVALDDDSVIYPNLNEWTQAGDPKRLFPYDPHRPLVSPLMETHIIVRRADTSAGAGQSKKPLHLCAANEWIRVERDGVRSWKRRDRLDDNDFLFGAQVIHPIIATDLERPIPAPEDVA